MIKAREQIPLTLSRHPSLSVSVTPVLLKLFDVAGYFSYVPQTGIFVPYYNNFNNVKLETHYMLVDNYSCTSTSTHTALDSSNLLSGLLRCGTRLFEWDTQWELNSLMKVC